jgi:hypothetical protein
MNLEVSKASIPCRFHIQIPHLHCSEYSLYLVAEQMIQAQLFEQETKWKLVFSRLDAKVNKSCELYGLCLDLLKSGGGIHFPKESSTGLVTITPLKPKQS